MKKLSWIAVLGMMIGISAPAQAEELHGSIAFSQDDDGAYAWGIAWSFDSAAGAHAEALGQCREYGGTRCAEVGWFREACGALAIGDGNGYGTGWGATTGEAESDALAQCRASNDDCRLEVARCAQSEEAGGRGQMDSEDNAARHDTAGASESFEPKCSDLEQSPPATSGPEFVAIENCWAALTSHPGCYFWQHYGTEGSTYTWSGTCSGGAADGKGIVTEHIHPDLYSDKTVVEGTLVKGRWHGTRTQTDYYDNGQSTTFAPAIFEHGRFIRQAD